VAGDRLTRDAIEEEDAVSPIFEQSALVTAVRNSGISHVVALDGFLGEVDGAEPNRVQKLYRDASLTFWVELTEGDVALVVDEVPGAPGASVVWVRRGAPLMLGTSFPDEENLPERMTPEDLLTEGHPTEVDPPLWADVAFAEPVERERR
jgi:hypothetical protein